MQKTIIIKRTNTGQSIVEKQGERPIVYQNLTELIINEFTSEEVAETYKNSSEMEVEITVNIKSSK